MTTARTITGGTLGEAIDAAEDVPGQTVIRSRANPVFPVGGNGGVARQSVSRQRRHQIRRRHPGPVAAHRPCRGVRWRGRHGRPHRRPGAGRDTARTCWCCATPGHAGAPGMPEAGYLPIPKKLARAGVKDMVRISDARMSGTAFGTIVLHMVPEAAVGGPLALVRTGDLIQLDVAGRRIDLLVDEAELDRRRAAWVGAPAAPLGRRQGIPEIVSGQRDAGGRGLRFRLPGSSRLRPQPVALTKTLFSETYNCYRGPLQSGPAGRCDRGPTPPRLRRCPRHPHVPAMAGGIELDFIMAIRHHASTTRRRTHHKIGSFEVKHVAHAAHPWRRRYRRTFGGDHASDR